MLVPSAYMQSMSAFVAQNMGAGNPKRADWALLCGVSTAFCVGLLMCVLTFFHGDLMAALFSSDAAVIAAAHSYLKAYAIDCLLTSFLFCFIGYFNGREKTLFVMLQGLIGAFGVRIPIVWLVSRIPGATLFQIGLGTPASSLVPGDAVPGDVFLDAPAKPEAWIMAAKLVFYRLQCYNKGRISSWITA